jgi:branched-chain amino acid transport system ATP-binding protein
MSGDEVTDQTVDAEHAGNQPRTDRANALRLDGVSAWYGSAQALFDVSLHVEAGETVGLLGRNGAGKSTTFKATMGIEVRRTGTVELFDDDMGRRSTDQIARAGVGWVPEDRRLFPGLTVAENIGIATAAAPPEGPVPVDELVDAFPLLGKLLGRRGDQLSGGEQQVVSVARALAARPRLLLLDEPTEGLAPVVVAQLEESIARLPADFGVSILLAEQNLAFVLRLTSRVYVLETGRIAHAGDTATFAADSSLQERYLSVSSSGATPR